MKEPRPPKSWTKTALAAGAAIGASLMWLSQSTDILPEKPSEVMNAPQSQSTHRCDTLSGHVQAALTEFRPTVSPQTELIEPSPLRQLKALRLRDPSAEAIEIPFGLPKARPLRLLPDDPKVAASRSYVIPSDWRADPWPHWQILTNPLTGIRKQAVLRDNMFFCADLMSHRAALAENASCSAVTPTCEFDLRHKIRRFDNITLVTFPTVNVGHLRLFRTFASKLRPADVLLEAEYFAKVLAQFGPTKGPLWEDVSARGALTLLLEGPSSSSHDRVLKSTAALPLHVPPPHALVHLSPTSPMLLHLVANDFTVYQADDEGEVTLNEFSKFREHQGNETLPSFLQQWRANRSMTAVYMRAAAVAESFRSSSMANGSFLQSMVLAPTISSPSQIDGKTLSIGQGVFAIRNRLVRLSLTTDGRFDDDLQASMEAVLGIGIETANNTGRPLLPGLLSRAANHVRSSAVDAFTGQWNMSDLPPWLVVPSHVNGANCLDQPAANRKSLLILGSSHARNFAEEACLSYVTGLMASYTAREGHPPRVATPPTTLCLAFNSTPLMPGAKDYKYISRYNPVIWNLLPPDDPIRLGKGLHWSSDRATIDSVVMNSKVAPPIVVMLNRVTHTSFKRVDENVVDLARVEMEILAEAAARFGVSASISKGAPWKPKQGPWRTELPGLVAHAEQITSGIKELLDPNNTDSVAIPFRYSDFVSWAGSSPGRFTYRGTFSEVVYCNGAWESGPKDVTMPGHIEDMAMTVDLIEELLKPQKIILALPYRYHLISTLNDPTGEEHRLLDELVPNALIRADQKALHAAVDPAEVLGNFTIPYNTSGQTAVEMDLHSIWPEGKTHQPCLSLPRVARLRDALTCLVGEGDQRRGWVTARERVRNAWAQRFKNAIAAEILRHTGRNVSARITMESHQGVAEETPQTLVELFDVAGPTSQSPGPLFVDPAGHHYGGFTREAMNQRLLRDHVCPPRHVMALPPQANGAFGSRPLRPDGGVDGADGQRLFHPVTTATPASQPLINYARSPLPFLFPFPTCVGPVFIRVRQTPRAAHEMPTLQEEEEQYVDSSGRNASRSFFVITNLFPLHKTPLLEVSAAACHAAFDHPDSLLALSGRAVLPTWHPLSKVGVPMRNAFEVDMEALGFAQQRGTSFRSTYDLGNRFAVSPQCSDFKWNCLDPSGTIGKSLGMGKAVSQEMRRARQLGGVQTLARLIETSNKAFVPIYHTEYAQNDALFFTRALAAQAAQKPLSWCHLQSTDFLLRRLSTVVHMAVSPSEKVN